MPVQITRPDVADMVLRTFERSIHPELFVSLKTSTISFGGHKASLHLGHSGHQIAFSSDATVITEVATTKHDSLPEHRKVIDRRLIGYRTHMIDLPKIRYHCSYQLEHVPLDVYVQLHREFECDARTATLSVVLPGPTANSPDCISMLKCDVLREGLVVHAFHTFPHNAAILRCQTLFELLDDD